MHLDLESYHISPTKPSALCETNVSFAGGAMIVDAMMTRHFDLVSLWTIMWWVNSIYIVSVFGLNEMLEI